MPEGLATALSMDGLWSMGLAALAAGLVYGFAGFGSALIFIPLAASFLSPAQAAAQMALMGLGSVISVLPQALRLADRKRTLTMLVPAFAGLLLGALILKSVDVTPMRWGISAVVAATLAAMVMGWRTRTALRPATLAAVGGAAGLLGGATGLLGPVVILFNLAGREPAAVTRANTQAFLTLLSMAYLPVLALNGLIRAETLWLGLLLVPVYMAGTRLGHLLFDPARDGLYRALAYGVIALAVLVGLPVWD